MNHQLLLDYQTRYKNELNDCLDFWLTNSIDKENGGIYNCLDREGKVFSTDKMVWLLGRCVWMFSYLCNQYGVKNEWKNIADTCLEFLEKFCIDKNDGRMYFLVTADGKPLRKRRYFFSETFYIMACAEYGKAFNNKKVLENAKKYYDFIIDIYRNPENDPYKITPKYIVDTRKMKAFSYPMILLNVSQIMRMCDLSNSNKYDSIASELISDIFKYFYKEDLKAILETTGNNGEFLSSISTGRTINPGHEIEFAWFLLIQARNAADPHLINKVENIFNWAIEIGWDKEYGGLFYFRDILGYPPEQIEHSMKLWWPICESLICSILLYEETGNKKYFEWFEKIDKYAFSKLKDNLYKEWFGYLHIDGTPTLPALKGGLFKGPFHLPRMLSMVEQCLERCRSK